MVALAPSHDACQHACGLKAMRRLPGQDTLMEHLASPRDTGHQELAGGPNEDPQKYEATGDGADMSFELPQRRPRIETGQESLHHLRIGAGWQFLPEALGELGPQRADRRVEVDEQPLEGKGRGSLGAGRSRPHPGYLPHQVAREPQRNLVLGQLEEPGTWQAEGIQPVGRSPRWLGFYQECGILELLQEELAAPSAGPWGREVLTERAREPRPRMEDANAEIGTHLDRCNGVNCRLVHAVLQLGSAVGTNGPMPREPRASARHPERGAIVLRVAPECALQGTDVVLKGVIEGSLVGG